MERVKIYEGASEVMNALLDGKKLSMSCKIKESPEHYYVWDKETDCILDESDESVPFNLCEDYIEYSCIITKERAYEMLLNDKSVEADRVVVTKHSEDAVEVIQRASVLLSI